MTRKALFVLCVFLVLLMPATVVLADGVGSDDSVITDAEVAKTVPVRSEPGINGVTYSGSTDVYTSLWTGTHTKAKSLARSGGSPYDVDKIGARARIWIRSGGEWVLKADSGWKYLYDSSDVVRDVSTGGACWLDDFYGKGDHYFKEGGFSLSFYTTDGC